MFVKPSLKLEGLTFIDYPLISWMGHPSIIGGYLGYILSLHCNKEHIFIVLFCTEEKNKG